MVIKSVNVGCGPWETLLSGHSPIEKRMSHTGGTCLVKAVDGNIGPGEVYKHDIRAVVASV